MPELKAKYQIRSGGDAGRSCVPVIVVRPFWTRLRLPIGEISQRVIGRSRTVDPAREGLIPYGSTDLTLHRKVDGT